MKLEVDTDPARLDLRLLHDYLSGESYWAKGVPLEVLRKGIENSLCFGVYAQAGARGGAGASGGAEARAGGAGAAAEEQVAFCRVITDLATFGWLSDVFVCPEYRGKGVSKALMDVVMSHPDLQGFRRFLLGTRDAHELYARYGFKGLAKPEIYMEIWEPGVYLKPKASG
jgi:GNAT superfamily N-acetyltransferase